MAFGIDLATDALWGNGDVNFAVFSSTFVVVAAASIVLQRRAVKRAVEREPIYPDFPVDDDGTPLTVVSVHLLGDAAGPKVEWLWARPIGDGEYRLRSVPLLARYVNRNDVVRCVSTEDGVSEVVAVTERGGHCTIRIEGPDGVADEVLPNLPEDLRGLIRGAENYLCLDVPPNVELERLAEVLDSLKDEDVSWYVVTPDFEDE